MASATRYSISLALKRGHALENPFHRRTREARAYDALLAGLVGSTQKRVGARRWKAIPFGRRVRLHRAVMLVLWLARSDAEAIAARRASPAEAERYLAYTNSVNRIVASLEEEAQPRGRSVAEIVAAMTKAND